MIEDGGSAILVSWPAKNTQVHILKVNSIKTFFKHFNLEVMLYLKHTKSLLVLIALVFLYGTIQAQLALPQQSDAPPNFSSRNQASFQGSLFPSSNLNKNLNGSLPPVYIDDSRAPGTVVRMDKDMYEYIRNWMLQGKQQSVPLTKALERRYDTSKINNFLLNFASGDSTYFLQPTAGSGRVKTSVKTDTVCRCKYLTFAEDGPQYAVVDMDPSQTTVFVSNPFLPANGYWPSFHGLHREAFGAGRAEFTDLHVVGKEDRKSPGQFELDSKVRMRVMYLCTDQNELPSDCGCDKRLHVEGEFRGELFSRATGGGIPGKDVDTKAEAGLIMTEYTVGENFQAIDFPAARLRGSFAEYKTSIDPKFTIKVFDLAQAAVTGVVTGGANTGQLLTDAADILKDVIGNDTIFVNTGNSSSPTPITGLGTANPWISPGMEKVFMLSSNTQYEVHVDADDWWVGQSWGYCASAFASAFRLHLFIDFDNTNPECCVEKYGMWAHGGYDLNLNGNGISFDTDPSSPDLSALQTALQTNFIGPWDNFNPNENFGSTTSSDQTCACNVQPVLDLLADDCDDVRIDVSNSVFPNNHYISIREVDALGNYIAPNYWGSWHPNLTNLNNVTLTGPNSILPNANLIPGHFYIIKLAVNGHCTGWNQTEVSFQLESAGEADFSVTSATCEDVSIELETEGALLHQITVVEVDANDNPVAGTSQTTGLLNNVSSGDVLDLASATGPLNYNFVAEKKYKITLEITTSCGTETKEQIITVSSTAIPDFNLEASCTEIMFDGTASQNVTAFEISVVEINIFGNPVGTPFSLTSGPVPVAGQITTVYDLMQVNGFTFVPGTNYRITLTVSNSCSGSQSLYKDFLHSIEPIPHVEGSSTVCEDDDYGVMIATSVALDDFRMEVFQSSQFGVPIGPVIDFTNGWVPFSTQNPLVLISPTPDITFAPGNWYTIRLYGRNSCSANTVMDLIVVRVIPEADCGLVQVQYELCKADFDYDPGFTTTKGGATEVKFLDKSFANPISIRRVWSYGDGRSDFGKTFNEHTYSRDGSYPVTLTVTDGDGCRDSVTKTIRIQSSQASIGRSTFGRRQGLEDGSLSTISPNPAGDMFKVTYDLEKDGVFTLMSVEGKEVLKLNLSASTDEVSVKTSNLPAGIYFGRVTEGESLIATHKIMIKH